MNFNLLRAGLMAALFTISVSSVFAADEAVELNASEIIMREVSIIGSKYNVKDIAGSAAYLGICGKKMVMVYFLTFLCVVWIPPALQKLQ